MDRERDLIRRLIEGRPEAWEEFGRQYGPLLTRACTYYLRRKLGIARPADVENALQQVLMTLYQKDRRVLRSFQWKSRFSTWLVAVSHRVCSKFLRSEIRHPNPMDGEILTEILDHRDPGEKPSRYPLTPEELQAGLGRLPRRDAILIRLIYYDGLSQKETAEVLGLSPASVPTLLARAKDRLRTLLKGAL